MLPLPSVCVCQNANLQSYLYKHPNPKHHGDLISTVRRIENAEEQIERAEKDCLQLLEEAKLQPCAIISSTGSSCNGTWLTSAIETLTNNNITRKHFSELVIASLKNGLGKGYNLMLCGPTNCAKSYAFN